VRACPDHNAGPLGLAAVGTALVLPSRLRREREVSHGSAVFQMARFGIGSDEPDEIDVILEHLKYLPFVGPALPGHPNSKGAAPKPRAKAFRKGTQTGFGEGVRSRRLRSKSFG